MNIASTQRYAALIRTHHVTSRKKLARVRKAAALHGLPYVLVRSGGSPGLMYGESFRASDLAAWVAAVQALRYKDFQCPCKPAPATAATATATAATAAAAAADGGGFEEVGSVAEFALRMESRGLGPWWRAGMGYSTGG